VWTHLVNHLAARKRPRRINAAARKRAGGQEGRHAPTTARGPIRLLRARSGRDSAMSAGGVWTFRTGALRGPYIRVITCCGSPNRRGLGRQARRRRRIPARTRLSAKQSARRRDWCLLCGRRRWLGPVRDRKSSGRIGDPELPERLKSVCRLVPLPQSREIGEEIRASQPGHPHPVAGATSPSLQAAEYDEPAVLERLRYYDGLPRERCRSRLDRHGARLFAAGP